MRSVYACAAAACLLAITTFAYAHDQQSAADRAAEDARTAPLIAIERAAGLRLRAFGENDLTEAKLAAFIDFAEASLRLAEAAPDHPYHLPSARDAFERLAAFAVRMGRRQLAVDAQTQAISLAEHDRTPKRYSETYEIGLARTYVGLGDIHKAFDEVSLALKAYREALRIQTGRGRTSAGSPHDFAGLHDVARIYLKIAPLYVAIEDFAEARLAYREAASLMRSGRSALPREWRNHCAVPNLEMLAAFRHAGDMANAEAEALEGLERCRQAYKASPREAKVKAAYLETLAARLASLDRDGRSIEAAEIAAEKDWLQARPK